MKPNNSVLHLFCGKMAAGKSTLAAQLADAPFHVLLSEDHWLDRLFADQMRDGADYLRCAARLRAAMGPHVADVLNAGLSVVLDFPANTVESRRWMRALLNDTQAGHVLHVLTPPDEVCLARLRARNASGDHPFAPTEADFHRFARHFEPPEESEGFHLRIHR